jgi:hypothetical protein
MTPCPGNLISEFRKYRLPSDPNQLYMFRRPAPLKEAFRDRHERGAGCDGR